MDKLRNIDHLLKTSAEGLEDTSMDFSGDWLEIETKLKRRKNRIYATWFSLALIVLSGVSVLLINSFKNTDLTQPTQIVENTITAPDLELDDVTPSVEPSEITGAETAPQSANEQTPEHVNESYAPVDRAPILVDSDVNMPIHSPSEPPAPKTSMMPRVLRDLLVQADVELLKAPLILPHLEVNNSIVDDNTSEEDRMAGHWELGVSVTPSLSSKWLSENPTLAGLINESYFSIINQSENPNFAMDNRINVSYFWGNGFSLHSGIGISERTELVNYNYTITSWPVVNEAEKRIDAMTDLNPIAYVDVDYSGSNSYHFISIPLQLGYRFNLNENWEVRNRIGLSYMLLTDRLGKTPDYTYLTLLNLQDDTRINTSSFSTSLSTGVYYNFKNFVFGAEPIMNMNISSLSSNQSALRVRPYNYGFNLTTNYKLHRK